MARLGVDGDRLLARLAALAQVSDEGPGVTRLAYSPADVRARDMVAGWMAEAGLEVWVDAATNLIGRLPGRCVPGDGVPGDGLPGDGVPGDGRSGGALPGGGGRCSHYLSTGSHLDTVVQAGALDGAYGVVAAVEVAATLARSGGLDHSLVVVAFANEEGARGTAGLNGSRAIGRPDTVDLAARDDEGVSLGDRLRAAGGDASLIGSAAWRPGALLAHVELHVEQGPILDRSGQSIGAVEAITGQRQLEVEIVGQANHAGTTPMAGRRDALVAAALFIAAVEHVTGPGGVRVATVGRLAVEPNVRNVVPGRVRLTVDLRDAERQRIDAATTELERQGQRIAVERDVTVSLRVLHDVPPTPCHPVVCDAVSQAAEHLGLAWQPMVSGASHDTQSMTALGPVGMIFVPSTGGVSHAPGESTARDDLIAGAEVLLATLSRLDRGPLCPRQRRVAG